ncbi:Lipid A core - O-antigen ligase and related enzymes [Actinomyces bovis]|uniref:Lipid A core - O-antigen ligase and related enzymes n=1 Tax=Actinomyces bovis TaxID=1658 RepID=A0ABY1VPP8_9ACTO|nr:O-antigen ligase family protein [Actinomyces bovis]SPT53975.1 Lipid A core - O-antigen ligase and related enzymes [Actinomyces bovis]VEG53520.1 Lipid A core - O-antigen ligase and related enzymes [Actinomyces israelii]
MTQPSNLRQLLLPETPPRLKLMPAAGTWAFFLTFAGQSVRNLVGWKSFGLIAAVSGLLLLWVFIREGHCVKWPALPTTIGLYVVLCALSIIWSAYPAETALASALMIATTAVGVLLACGLSLRQMTDALSRALEAALVLSILLELYVALVLRHPLAPLYMRGWEEVPITYYWVYGDILRGGPIQGIVGNRNPLAFIALLTLLCIAVRWADRRVKPISMVVWSALSLVVLALTNSATVWAAAAVCVAVMGYLWLMRHVPVRFRSWVVTAAVTVIVGLAAAALGWYTQLIALLGRSESMSARWEIWKAVLSLWQEHTILGWGWIMYWIPWIPVFSTILVRPDGTPTMNAHNAYIEALFQTGVVGGALIVVIVCVLVYRSFRLAGRHLNSDASVVLPALLMTALVMQSFTESRLLSEGNWVVVCALGTWLGLHRIVEERQGSEVPLTESQHLRAERRSFRNPG